MRWTTAIGLAAMLAVPAATAEARPMRVMASSPAAQAVMDGAATQFFVRFDGPVDHAASVLDVEEHGRVVQTRHPRLGSQPNVLYASFGHLASGIYVLRWTTRSMREHDASSGVIPFTVVAAGAP